MAPLRFAANVGRGWMWPRLSIRERMSAARDAGFDAVEIGFPYAEELSAGECKRLLRENGLELVLMNTRATLDRNSTSPTWAGTACLAGREGEFDTSLKEALSYASTTGCNLVHVLAGALPRSASYDDRQKARKVYVANMKRAAGLARAAGVKLVVEAINTEDAPGYFVSDVDMALELLEEINSKHVRLLLDVYHAQRTEGNIARLLIDNMRQIAHVQIAGVPDRHEPCYGEINYPYIFELLQRLGYAGSVGCEYHPMGDTDTGLRKWYRPERLHQGLPAISTPRHGKTPRAAPIDDSDSDDDDDEGSNLPYYFFAIVLIAFVWYTLRTPGAVTSTDRTPET